MITLIDTSIWVDFLRPRSSDKLKQHVASFIADPAAHVAEPVIFEICRNALPAETSLLTRRLESIPLLPTPADLWQRAIVLGQTCRRRGHTAGAMDLLIGAIAQSAGAGVITFDEDFERMGQAGGFEVKLLRRPA